MCPMSYQLEQVEKEAEPVVKNWLVYPWDEKWVDEHVHNKPRDIHVHQE